MPDRRDFEVVIELPKQIITVRAKDADDAVFKAWHMIGFAGVRLYGRITAEPAPTPATSTPPRRTLGHTNCMSALAQAEIARRSSSVRRPK